MVITIPGELRSLNQWVAWKFEDRDGYKTKVPLDAKSGNYASVSDTTTYSSFPQALRFLQESKASGLGFVFTSTDPFCGVDLDKCIDSNGINPKASEIIATLKSYTEISPSNHGIHVICKGSLPTGERRNGCVEMYDSGRFFCMTGHLWGKPLQIEERTPELEVIWRKFIKHEEDPYHVPAGDRHDAIFRTALNCARNGVAREVAEQHCFRIARESGFSSRRLSEVHKALDFAYQQSVVAGIYQSEQKAKILDVSKLIDWKAPDVDWLIPGLIPRNRVILSAGASQTGKSIFWSYTGLALSLGRSFGPFDGIKRGRVVYCVLEDSIATISSRLKDFSNDFGTLPDEEFYRMVFAYNFSLKAEMNQLSAWIKKMNIDLLIIDTYQKATTGVGSKDEEVHSALFHSMNRLVRDSNCSILIIDHTRKSMQFQRKTGESDQRAKLNLDDVIGSGKKVQNSDTVILMDRWENTLALSVRSKDLKHDMEYRLKIGDCPKYKELTYD